MRGTPLRRTVAAFAVASLAFTVAACGDDDADDPIDTVDLDPGEGTGAPDLNPDEGTGAPDVSDVVPGDTDMSEDTTMTEDTTG